MRLSSGPTWLPACVHGANSLFVGRRNTGIRFRKEVPSYQGGQNFSHVIQTFSYELLLASLALSEDVPFARLTQPLLRILDRDQLPIPLNVESCLTILDGAFSHYLRAYVNVFQQYQIVSTSSCRCQRFTFKECNSHP